jgi:hypothetical protein
MDTTIAGGWLIGTGSLVIFAGLIFGSEQPYQGIKFQGPFNTRSQRLRCAVEGAGAGLVAVGSALLAVEHPPSPWLLLVLPTAYLVVHLLMAWKLRQLWVARRAKIDGPDAIHIQWAACAAVCASWQWCLKHPFNDEHWPKAVMDAVAQDQEPQQLAAPLSTDRL